MFSIRSGSSVDSYVPILLENSPVVNFSARSFSFGLLTEAVTHRLLAARDARKTKLLKWLNTADRLNLRLKVNGQRDMEAS